MGETMDMISTSQSTQQTLNQKHSGTLLQSHFLGLKISRVNAHLQRTVGTLEAFPKSTQTSCQHSPGAGISSLGSPAQLSPAQRTLSSGTSVSARVTD